MKKFYLAVLVFFLGACNDSNVDNCFILDYNKMPYHFDISKNINYLSKIDTVYWHALIDGFMISMDSVELHFQNIKIKKNIQFYINKRSRLLTGFSISDNNNKDFLLKVLDLSYAQKDTSYFEQEIGSGINEIITETYFLNPDLKIKARITNDNFEYVLFIPYNSP
jgi:hypothetical protein